MCTTYSSTCRTQTLNCSGFCFFLCVSGFTNRRVASDIIPDLSVCVRQESDKADTVSTHARANRGRRQCPPPLPAKASQPATKASGSRAQGQAPRQGERPSTAAHTQRRRRLTLNGRSFRCWNDLAPHQMARSSRGRQPVSKSPDAYRRSSSTRELREFDFCLELVTPLVANLTLSSCLNRTSAM